MRAPGLGGWPATPHNGRNVRIAHLSDPHLLTPGWRQRLRDFANKRWIGGLNLLLSRGRDHRVAIFEAMVADINGAGIDHVIATGDITNLALDQEFAFAREAFDRIDLGPDHVTVIPGNHDAYVAEGVAGFATHFGGFARSDDDFTGGPPWPVVRVRGPVAIIGMSTSHQTPWFTCFGRLGTAQIGRLRQVLGDPRLAGCHRIVAIHHPPAGASSRSRIRGLHDWRALWSVLKESGCELVLHGHEHRDLHHEIPGPGGAIPVRGIPSATFGPAEPVPERTASYRIYEVGSAAAGRPAVCKEQVRAWDEAVGAFVEAPLAA